MAWKPSYRDISGPSLGFSDVPTRTLVLKKQLTWQGQCIVLP